MSGTSAAQSQSEGKAVEAHRAASAVTKSAPSASAVKKENRQVSEASSVKLSPKACGIRAYARLQVLIEYYFMESGLYPVSLQSLERSFNTGLPTDAPKVILGTDPLSGKPFVYQVSEDRHHYTLSVPEPEKYGSDLPTLETIDWGWLMLAAEGKRIERLLSDCTRNINELATACEIYAKDHNKAFPAKLESLRPQYMFRELRCPASSKPYIYTFRRGGYTIECPEPRRHGLGSIKYDSDRGLFVGGVESVGADNAEKKANSTVINSENSGAPAAKTEKK
ncbi:MAG: hypothetical protein ACI38Q_03345 [Candidatus Bruticola sp.]